MSTPSLRFAPTRSAQSFQRTLMERVEQYFNSRQVARQGDWRMYLKTTVMFTWYLVPYFVMVLVPMPLWVMLLLSVVMGLGLAGIGLSVMHDANHGAYARLPWLNRLVGYSMNFIGGSSLNWRIQHNVLHHTYTNVHGHDEDLEAGRVLRFSLHQPWKPHHRYQHLYALPLYSLLTAVWLYSDFPRLERYIKAGHVQQPNLQRVVLVLSKLGYLFYLLVLPMLLGITWWHWLLCFAVMHAVAGLTLSTIFQLAHVMDDNDILMPTEDTKVLPVEFAEHQIRTTANFANRNRLLTWYCGGLNHQIEHHLFPNVCHIHYSRLSNIVRETARDFNLPYVAYPSFLGALRAHLRYLKQVGRTATA